MSTLRAWQISLIIVTFIAIALGAVLWARFASSWPDADLLPMSPRALLPVPEYRQKIALTFPAHEIVLRVASAHDDLAALHRLQHLRTPNGTEPAPAMIASRDTGSSPKYDLLLRLPNDAVEATSLALNLGPPESRIVGSGWVVATRPDVRYWQEQTRMLEMLYGRIASHAAGPSDGGLTILADILRVAKHYSLPLVLFTEVGGRDHDYIDSAGLIRSAEWRTMPSSDDFVLARTPTSVLAIPKSAVSWKLTEQAIQYAQLLCTQDGIDTLRGLPTRLHPPPQLTRELPIGPVITYGGRILRDLVDLCHGNLECASQALSTNSTDATVRFDVGVRRTALYARRTLHHIAGIARSMIGNKYAARQ